MNRKAHTTLTPRSTARLLHVLETVSAMAVPTQRQRDLEREVARRAQARTAGDVDRYVDIVEREPVEAETLAQLLTIGETYFFRHWADFEVLRKVILPPLLEREERGGAPPLLWSAACATGEEAYSLAMLLESMQPNSRGEVVATDITEARLVVARDAAYRENSIRSVGGAILDRYLETAGPALWRVAKKPRARVRFARHNLQAERLPVHLLAGHVDVILCRNVLIYFGAATIAGVLGKLEAALAPDGWLIVSSAEATTKGWGGLQFHPFESSAVYRKTSPEDVPYRKPVSIAPLPRPTPRVLTPPPTETGAQALGRLLLARARRDRARGGEDALRRAARLAAAAVERLPLVPEPARVAALVLIDLGDPAAALPHARRAASLAPDDPLSNFAFGRALQGVGHHDAAMLALRNAERAAAKMRPTTVLDDGEGVTAAVLASALRAERENAR